jgi:long-chain fatty acid transport protein
MPSRSIPRWRWPSLLAVLVLVSLGAPARAQFGLAVSGVGPINRSMGGASTAAPLDSAGALYWNPATITELQSEMEFGTGIIVPRTTISSFAGAGAFGPGTPPINVQGTTGGNNGVFLLPVIGIVYNPKDSILTYGFGVFEIGGFGVNYAVTPTNPVLNPQFPNGKGVAPLYTQYQLFQFAPSVAMKLTDSFSLGFQANIDMGTLMANPALFSSPALVNGASGPGPVYPSAMQGRSRAGAGFMVGAYYSLNDNWSFGASFKSPQWFDTYRFNSVSPDGSPRTPQFNLNFPLVASAGLAYKGIDKLLIASDFRFLDFRDAAGFNHSGFDQTGAVRGLGWQNVFALGVGAQYQWTDELSTRIGYTFSLNPVGPSLTMFNIGSPTIIQHSLAVGGSYNITKNFKVSVAWAHDFQNAITGPIVQPFVGAVPNTWVRSASTADTVFFGATVLF